jgi:polyisoprenoid-binding protein YceI
MIKVSELTGDYMLDSSASRISFVVPTVLVAKVRGQFDEFEAAARLDGDDPSKSSVLLTIQANSIQTRNERRDDHLRRAFLHAPEHPVITFCSTKVEQKDETHFDVTGDLTIRGVTRPVAVPLELTGADDRPDRPVRIRFAGRATIIRRDWGVKWNAVGEAGGFLVGESVTLELDLAATRRT